ncbi:MAG: MarR family transcriptional regulator [Clostridiaceae bacterium]|jgi:pseudouridine kinase|nr:MarR family transcriptional regulator [Clostridiaceae bacterium]
MVVSDQRDSFWIVAGGLNLDVLATPTGSFRPRDSNPGTIIERPGGVGFNIARNLALLDQKICFLTARGDDHAGQMLVDIAQEKTIDLSHALVRECYATSHYLAIHDEEGDMVAAINDMAVIDTLTPKDVETWFALGKAEVPSENDKTDKQSGCLGAIVEPNLPVDVLVELASQWDVPLFADAVSQAKIDRLIPILPYLTGLKLNRIEARQLTGLPVRSIEEAVQAANVLIERGVRCVCLSLDVDGALFADAGHCFAAHPVKLNNDANTTGAGDAMAAVFAWATVRKFTLEQTARLGIAASSIAVESAEAVNPALEIQLLMERSETIESFRVAR